MTCGSGLSLIASLHISAGQAQRDEAWTDKPEPRQVSDHRSEPTEQPA